MHFSSHRRQPFIMMAHRISKTIFALGAALLCAIVLSGCSQSAPSLPSPDPQPLPGEPAAASTVGRFDFEDMSLSTGIDTAYQNGESTGNKSIVESLGGGVGAIDFDCDGNLDLLFPGGGLIDTGLPLSGKPVGMWRNLGNWQFVSCGSDAGVETENLYTHGVAVGDINQDGFADFLLTGYGGLQLFVNQGDGTFIDRTDSLGFSGDLWSSSAAFADFNGDGLLDLYVTHYVDWSWQKHPRCKSTDRSQTDVCAPGDFSALPDTLYMASQDGSFYDATIESGLVTGGKGLGVIACNLVNTPGIDIYVANDTTNNFLYLNAGEGRFLERGLISGVAVDGTGTPNGSMGLAIVDFNQDLLSDIWVTNYESEPFGLYQNIDGGAFLFATNRAGVNRLGDLFVGFGTVAADLDLDGDEDLVVANGHVIQHPREATVAQFPLLLESTSYDFDGAPSQFERVSFSSESYFGNMHRGRGLIAADFDQDGDLDLVFTHINRPPAILSNRATGKGKLLSIELIGTTSNRQAIGASLVMRTKDRAAVRQVVGGGSYLSQNPYSIFFTILPGETIESLEIQWPSGIRQAIHDWGSCETVPENWQRQVIEPEDENQSENSLGPVG